MSRYRWVLLGILILAFLVRVYKLNSIPVSLYMDEATVGYDAYSLSVSGVDQWGKPWPIIFKSFGEYKYPWQTYAALISGSILGWSNFSIRFPSVIVAVFGIFFLYQLVSILTGNKQIATFAAFFVAVSPWHIQFTRMAWESGYVLGLMFFGLWAIFFGQKRHGWMISVGIISLGMTMFAYNSAKIVSPLVLVWTLVVYWRGIWKQRRWLVIGVALFVIMGFANIFSPELSGLYRYKEVGVNESVVRETFSFKYSQVYRLGLAEVWLRQYLMHFTPQYLVLSGDSNPRHSIQSVGELLGVEYLFIIIGLGYLLYKKQRWLIWASGWVFISPIPAAITNEAPHALRSILGLGAWQIIAAAGLSTIITLVRKSRFWKVFYTVLGLVICINIGYYLIEYFLIYPNKYSNEWQYGYSVIFQDFSKYDNYSAVVISDGYAQPYIFLLWNAKIRYEDFVKDSEKNQPPYAISSRIKRIGKYYFEPINYASLPTGKLLVYTTPGEKLNQLPYSWVVNNPDGTVAFYVYEIDKK